MATYGVKVMLFLYFLVTLLLIPCYCIFFFWQMCAQW